MSYRHIDTETLLRRIAELVEARRELDAQLRVLTGMRRGRRVAKWLPRLVFLLFAGVLLVVALVAAALPCMCSGSRYDSTLSAAQTVSSGVQMYVAENPGGGCPTLDDLVTDGYLNVSPRTRDAWDHDFQIRCDSDEVHVVSAGPDGQLFTADDIE